MARSRPGTLVIVGADDAQRRVALDRNVTTLGRADTCAVALHSATVSRLHASIALEHDRYLISDAGSANGTFVNGARIEGPRQLSSGDVIWLGGPENTLAFHDPEETVTMGVGAPPLLIDEGARVVQVYGAPAPLSPLEYNLLRYLAVNRGTACTREETFLAVWGQPYDPATCEDALNACVAKLRRNLRATAESAGQAPPAITTVHRVGLRLDSEVVLVTVEPAPGASR
jgi:DNA-binding winged helix-turn-helix (wHTH) protein